MQRGAYPAFHSAQGHPQPSTALSTESPSCKPTPTSFAKLLMPAVSRRQCRSRNGSYCRVARPPSWAEAMKWFSVLRRPIIRSMIGVLLFAQMALAAYACPSLTKATLAGASMHSQVLEGMPADANQSIQASPAMGAINGAHSMPVDCEQVDVEAPNLCAEYCKQGQQSADHTPSSTIAPVFLTALYSVMHSTAAPTAEAAYYAPGMLLQAAGPPHAIEHCCLRT